MKGSYALCTSYQLLFNKLPPNLVGKNKDKPFTVFLSQEFTVAYPSSLGLSSAVKSQARCHLHFWGPASAMAPSLFGCYAGCWLETSVPLVFTVGCLNILTMCQFTFPPRGRSKTARQKLFYLLWPSLGRFFLGQICHILLVTQVSSMTCRRRQYKGMNDKRQSSWGCHRDWLPHSLSNWWVKTTLTVSFTDCLEYICTIKLNLNS
jgi:hypothetical protein